MTKQELTSYIQEKFSGEIQVIENDQKEPYLIIQPKDLHRFCRFIYDDTRLLLTFLMNMSGVDTKERFEVVYNVCSYRYKLRLYFKILIPYDKAEFDTIRDIWPVADWFEREIWELFGVNVNGHPNLKRFLLPDDWDQGYPMRKDWQGRDVITLPER